MANEPKSRFSYVAFDHEGAKRKGTVTADSETEARAQLAGQDLTPVELIERKPNFLSNLGSSSTVKVSKATTATFARQLHLMLRAGLAVPRAVEALGEDTSNPKVTLMCSDISEKTSGGMPLSKAMAEYPKVFDEVFCSYVAAGEQAGTLETSVERLAHMLDQGQKMRTKVKAVTAYPKMVTIAIGVMVIGILMFLVPKYAEIYASFGAQLPAPTQMMVRLSENIMPIRVQVGLMPPSIWKRPDDPIWQSPFNIFSPLLWIGVFFFSYRAWRRSKADDLAVGTAIERIKFRLPLMGKLTKYQALFRWSSTLAGSLQAGLQLVTAMELAARSSGSAWIQLVTKQGVAAVQAGRPLSSEINKHPDLFYGQIRALIMTGEETGEPGEMFGHIADTLEDEIDALVATLGAKIEVALLMTMGAVVGSMLVVLYLPILNLSQAASEGYANPKSPAAGGKGGK